MRGVPPSASWYGDGLSATTSDGGVVYASDRSVVALDGENGAVRGIASTKARISAICIVERNDGDEGETAVCGCVDKTVRVLDLREMRFRGRGLVGGHKHEVTAVCALGGNRVASGCRSGAVSVWEMSDGGALVSTHKSVEGPITTMAASPSGVIAVGGANGMVCTLDAATGASHRVAASGLGEITSLSWTSARTEDGQTLDMLAVGSREKRVSVWALEDGKLIATHALHLPKPNATLSEAQRGRVWVAVSWAEPFEDESACRLISSGQGGELLSWKVPLNFGEGVMDVNEAKAFGPRSVAHARTVFTVITAEDKCWSTSLDRKVACWDLDTHEQIWSFTALGGYVYDLAIDKEDPFAVAMACGDGTVHGWDLSPTLSGGMGESLLWKGLPNTKVTCVARKAQSDIVAFGLEDGRVGCFDSTTGKFACYPECHAAAVQSLQWLVIRAEDDDEDEGMVTLTSIGADGSLWRWLETLDPSSSDVKKSGVVDARKFGKYLDLSKLCAGEHPSSTIKMSAFEYSPRLGRLACGWSSGELSLHDFGEEKWKTQEHSKSVSRICWHPECDDENGDYFSWIMAASTSGTVLVHGIDGAVVCGLPRASVYDVAWSFKSGAAILACAQHSCVKLWEIQKMTNGYVPVVIANLHGHAGKVMCVKFCAHDDNFVISGGDDKTFRVWDYTEAKHAPSESKEESSQCASPTSVEDKVSKSKEAASSHKKPAKAKKTRATGISGALFKPSAVESTPDGILAGQRAVVDLAKLVYQDAAASLPPEALRYGPSGIALYMDTQSAMDCLSSEAQTVSDTASMAEIERSAALHIYKGDYAEAASVLLKASDAPISNDFMSLFVGGGYAVWTTVAEAQCERLVAASEFQRAAMLKLSMQDVRGAIDILRMGGLIRDASALAAARLLPTDDLLSEIRRELAAAEETRGGMEAAAKAHLSTGAPSAAVRALTRVEHGGALAAARVSLACELTGPSERQVVLRAAKELAETGDANEALDILSSLDALLRRNDDIIDITTSLRELSTSDHVLDLADRFKAMKASL